MKYISYFFAALLIIVWLTGILFYQATGIFHLIFALAVFIIAFRVVEGNMSLKKYRKYKE